jgi:hypothetical protein
VEGEGMNFLEMWFIKRSIENFKRKAEKMAEKENKPWYLSRGVVGGLVAVMIGVAGTLFGIAGLEAEKEQIIDMVLQISTIIAGAVAMWGRLRAKKDIQ